MRLAAARDMVSAAAAQDGKRLSIISAQRAYYRVYRRGRLLTRFNVVIMTEQPFRYTQIPTLFVKDALTAAIKSRIIAAFQGFNAASGDPIQYAISKLDKDIAMDSFSVMATYRLDKVGPPVPHTEQRDHILRLLDGTARGTVDAAGMELKDYMGRQGLTVLLDRIEDVGNPPPTQKDAVHEQDVPNPIADPGDVFWNGVLGHDNDAKTECKVTAVERDRILTLLAWPEFMVKWEDTRIDIGCGVTIVLTLPHLYARVGTLVIWAYIGHTNDQFGLILDQVIMALIKAALSAIVIGLVTENYYAAAAAFEAEFESALWSYALADLKCLFPGIEVLRQNTAWVMSESLTQKPMPEQGT
jgi:hypothetical protein